MANELKKGSKGHADLLRLIQELIKVSDDKLQERVDGWDVAEKMNQSYMPAADAERAMKRQNENWTESFTKLTIPYCYGVQMAMHTYLASVLLSRSPIYQALGRNGQGQNQQLVVDSLIDYQVVAGEMLPPLYLWLNDILQYGFGVYELYWEEESTFITAYAQQPMLSDGVPVLNEMGLPKTERVESVIETPGYKGHKMANVRPREFLFDTRVPLIQFQQGEFCGRRTRWNTNYLEELKAGGEYFNLDEALGMAAGKDSDLAGDSPAMVETSDQLVYGQKKAKGMVNIVVMYVKLVPSMYGLGQNRRQEIWRITVADKVTIIDARPAGWLHGMFPYVVQPFEFDAHTLSSRGVPVIGRALNDSMDWLLNSHMFNLKKAVNNEYIFDPSKISTRDFLDPAPGKRIRLLPAGYGRDIRTMVHQLPQVDYTRQNVSDIAFFEGLFQRVFGATPQMMGGQQMGGRRSATEVRTQQAGGVSRLKVLCEFISATSFTPAFRMLLSGSRQMYTEEMMLRIAGDAQASRMQSLKVSPSELSGEFDFIPVDGTLPIDRFATASLYQQLLMGAGQLPQVVGRYDIAGIFAWIAKLSGIRNLDTFEITPENENKIAQEVQRGNLVNANEVMNGRLRGTSGGTAEGSSGTPGASAIPGVGQAG